MTHQENASARLQKELQAKFLCSRNCRTSRHKGRYEQHFENVLDQSLP